MIVDLVMRIRDPKQIGRTLSREMDFPVVPNVGDGVIWHGDWAVETCIYRYIGTHYAEVGLTPCGPADVEALVAAGWILR